MNLVEFYLGRGELDPATEALTDAERLRPVAPWTKMLEAYLAVAKGDRGRAGQLLARLQESFPDWPGLAAIVLGALGDLDGFIEKVRAAFDKHSMHTDTLMCSALCARARSGPRYDPMIAEMRASWFGEIR